MHSYKVDISKYSFYHLIVTFEKFYPVSRIFDNEDDIFYIFKECSKIQRHRNIIFLNQLIIKYELYMNASMRRKIIDDYCFQYMSDLLRIKLIMLRSQLNVATF